MSQRTRPDTISLDRHEIVQERMDMQEIIRKSLQSRHGQGVLEYVLVLTLVAVVSIKALTLMSGSL